MAVIEQTLNADSYGGRPLKFVRADYDFAVDGGAISTIGLTGGLVIPSGAIVLWGLVEVRTAFTTGSAATLALQVNAANDIVTAAVVSGAPWSTTGLKAVIPAWTAATAVKTTAARDVSAVIATGTITAGKMSCTLFYIDPTP